MLKYFDTLFKHLMVNKDYRTTWFCTVFKHLMVNGRLLNREVKTWHMDIIFMSSVYTVYVWTCLKLFQDVDSKWSNKGKHYCFKWLLSLVTSRLVAHVIYQAHTPCLIPILLTGKVVWPVWLTCGHFADFCLKKDAQYSCYNKCGHKFRWTFPEVPLMQRK